MQAAGMLRGTGAMKGFHVLVISTLILAYIGHNAHALPLQILPNIPGYIPVYIRNGDQPLDEINPALAEAFHEKQTLESVPPERLDHSPDDLGENLENHSSYDNNDEDTDDDGLNAGTRRKGTIFLIGVRQSTNDRTRNDEDLGSKIALPFEILGEKMMDANSSDNRDDEKFKDVWIEELGKESNARKPIGLSKEAIIKASGLPVDVKDLERLAAEVEREETRPNDLYDSAIIASNDRHVTSSRRPISNISIGDEITKDREITERIIDDIVDDSRIIRPIEDPKEFRASSSSSKPSMYEKTLWTPRDPSKSRPNDDWTDFMVQEE